MTLNTTEIPPFIQLISQLRESSKSAIVNGEGYTLTDLQKYQDLFKLNQVLGNELSKVAFLDEEKGLDASISKTINYTMF